MYTPKRICALLPGLLLLASSFTLAQQTATGVVFEDRNQNGKKDRSEPGLAQVAVSNGREVVQTDPNGRYQLPVGRDNILFVIKPQGYRLPVNAQNLPQFFYRHKPEGSPKTKVPGVAPTGPLPKSVDFALLKADEPTNYQALIFGDSQVTNPQEVTFFERGIIDELSGKTAPFQFGLTLGDLVNDKPALYPAYIQAVSRLKLPWFQVMGNHDMNYDSKSDSLSDETFEATFGPNNYAFNQGQVHFIVLDDVLYPDPRDSSGYQGGLRPDQLDFVENDLKYVPKDRLVVLCHHIPLFNEGDAETFRNADRQRLFNLLSAFPNTLSLSAHTHIQQHYLFTKADGLNRATPHHEYNVGTTCGDWYSGEADSKGIPGSTMRDGTPKGYLFLTFQGNQYSFDYRIAGMPETYKIGLHAPHVVNAGQSGRYDIYANFFQGSPRDSLTYRIDGQAWKPMRWVAEPDPVMTAVSSRWETTDKPLPGIRPSRPVPSTHLWKAPLTGNLPVGEHQIEVQARDAFGRTFTNKASFRVVAETPRPAEK